MRAMNELLGNRIASRRYSPAPIGGRVMEAARDTFKKRGFAQVQILSHWPEIVGETLAEYCAPEKLSFPRFSKEEKQKGPSTGAVLTLRVEGPAAVEIQHLEPQIVSRINAYYGYDAVARLKLVQGPLPHKPVRKRRKIRALTPDERKKLGQELESIEETPLRGALARLGERVIGANKR